MKVARTPLEGARAEEARWAGLLPGEEPGRGRRRQVEEVEGEEAAGARRAREQEAAAGPDVAVAPAVRPSRQQWVTGSSPVRRHEEAPLRLDLAPPNTPSSGPLSSSFLSVFL